MIGITHLSGYDISQLVRSLLDIHSWKMYWSSNLHQPLLECLCYTTVMSYN